MARSFLSDLQKIFPNNAKPAAPFGTGHGYGHTKTIQENEMSDYGSKLQKLKQHYAQLTYR
jgi:hypothetical protein